MQFLTSGTVTGAGQTGRSGQPPSGHREPPCPQSQAVPRTQMTSVKPVGGPVAISVRRDSWIAPELLDHLPEAVDVLPDACLVGDRVQEGLALADEKSAGWRGQSTGKARSAGSGPSSKRNIQICF